MEVKTIVLRVDGTNCDEETVIAFREAGSEVDLVHMNELVRKEKSLEDYQILCIPEKSLPFYSSTKSAKTLRSLSRRESWFSVYATDSRSWLKLDCYRR
jgi:hypothetical protein